ncbi:MAG: hypothetical protein GF408_06545 [Candidatus Omnitrophica bacterium]|nr:hypothetical protein [Candidatus Omnitrophota bacterium]
MLSTIFTRNKWIKVLTIFSCICIISGPAAISEITYTKPVTLYEKENLSPLSRIKPLVRLEKKGGSSFEILEDEEEKGRLIDRFKEDTAFIYLTLLISQAIDLDIGVETLKFLIRTQLEHIDLSRFRVADMFSDGNTYCLPYDRKDGEYTQLLRFYKDPAGVIDNAPAVQVSPDDIRKASSFPDNIFMQVGDIWVIMEDPVYRPASVKGKRSAPADGVTDPAVPMTKDEYASRARDEFDAALEDFIKASSERPLSYDALELYADKALRRIEAWEVKWAEGFGAERHVRSLSGSFKRMIEVITYYRVNYSYDESGEKREREIYPLIRNARRSIEYIKTSLSRDSEEIDIEKFYIPAGPRTVFDLQDELEGIYDSFMDMRERRSRGKWSLMKLRALQSEAAVLSKRLSRWVYEWSHHPSVLSSGNKKAPNTVYEAARVAAAALREAAVIDSVYRDKFPDKYDNSILEDYLSDIFYMLNAPFNSVHSSLSTATMQMSYAIDDLRETEALEKHIRMKKKSPSAEISEAKAQMETLLEDYRELRRYEDYGHLHEKRIEKMIEAIQKWERRYSKADEDNEDLKEAVDALEEVARISRESIQKHQYLYTTPVLEQINNTESIISLQFKAARKLDEIRTRLEERLVSLSAKSKAEALVDSLKWMAREAGDKGEKIILALDTSWNPSDTMQPLLSELFRLSRIEGLDNMIVIRGKGQNFAEEIIQKQRDTGTKLSNVIAIGSRDSINHLRNAAFAAYRGFAFEEKAFLAAVDPSNLVPNSYVNMVDMVTAAVRFALGQSDSLEIAGIKAVPDGNNPRIWRFIPEARAMDLEELKELVDAERRALISA